MLSLDPDLLPRQFERAPFLIEHQLVEHPLLQLSQIVQLASALPAQSVEFNRGDISPDQDYLKTPKTGLSSAETLQQIESCQSWMVLKNIEHDASYAALVRACIAQVRPYAGAAAPEIFHEEGFIFVSSPRAVTPYHCDPEHNFLLQIRGSKRVAVFDRDDAAAVTQPQLEAIAGGAHRNLPYVEAMGDRARLFSLNPGQGLHIPVHCPHWVRVDGEVSISLSVTFRSRATRRREAALRINARLRRLGVDPRRPGVRVLGDEAKFLAERALGVLSRSR